MSDEERHVHDHLNHESDPDHCVLCCEQRLDLAKLQEEIDRRWGSASYKPGVQHADHAVLHLVKALGKIAASVEQASHINGEEIDVRKQVADLVICASRLASLLGLTLEEIVGDRLAEKFPASKE